MTGAGDASERPDPTRRFLEYAAAFEKTYADDDWSRLEAYFLDDACYVVSGGPPLGGEWQGRAAVLRHLHEIVDQLDRRFESRELELVGELVARPDSIEFEWRARYRNPGMPELIIGGRERALFEGNRIARLEDTMEDGADVRIQQWLEEHPTP